MDLKRNWWLIEYPLAHISDCKQRCIYALWEKKLEDREFPNGIARFLVGQQKADIELILAAVIEKS